MRILFFSHLFPNRYEPNSGIFNIQRGNILKRMGHEVYFMVPISIMPPIKHLLPIPQPLTVINYYDSFKLVGEEYGFTKDKVYSVKWFPLPKQFFWAYQNWALNYSAGRSIEKIVNEINPDIIITSVLNPEGTYSKYFKEVRNIPVIAIAEGSELLVYPKYYKNTSHIIDTINKYCDVVVFVSGNMAATVSEMYKFKNMRVIKNGYDREIFNLKKRINKKNKMTHVISVGNLEEVKGHDVLLEAVKIFTDMKLTLVGDGDCFDKYSAFVNDNNLAGRVELLGYLKQEELRELYEIADLFCMPSRSEGFGIAALEALACGIPVIATPAGELKYIIKNGINGFLVDNLSPDVLAEKIFISSTINWDGELIASTVDKYGWDKWGEEMVDLFNELFTKNSMEKMLCDG